MPMSKSARMKRNYLKARENYLIKLRQVIAPTKRKRTIQDTARTLNGLKLQHKFMLAERKRLEHTIIKLQERGKKVDPLFIKRLKKVKKEDKESQARFKSIKYYFETEMKGEK